MFSHWVRLFVGCSLKPKTNSHIGPFVRGMLCANSFGVRSTHVLNVPFASPFSSSIIIKIIKIVVGIVIIIISNNHYYNNNHSYNNNNNEIIIIIIIII